MIRTVNAAKIAVLTDKSAYSFERISKECLQEGKFNVIDKKYYKLYAYI